MCFEVLYKQQLLDNQNDNDNVRNERAKKGNGKKLSAWVRLKEINHERENSNSNGTEREQSIGKYIIFD